MGAKEAIKVGFDYFKANASGVSASVKVADHDYHLHIVELQNTGPTTAMSLRKRVSVDNNFANSRLRSEEEAVKKDRSWTEDKALLRSNLSAVQSQVWKPESSWETKLLSLPSKIAPMRKTYATDDSS